MNTIIIKNILSEEEENYLKSRLSNTLNYFKVRAEIAEEIYDRLYLEYSDWSRHYHNLSHILSMLKLSEKYAAEIKKNNQFDLAIWFHDAIYNAKKKDNEIQSAELLVQLMQPYLVKEDLMFIKSLILSTANHVPLSLEDSDHHFFLDFDLAVLSADRTVYQLYSDAIKEEYKTFFSFLVYGGGRKRVLESFYSRSSLYFSPVFKNLYEQQARENIAWEIGQL
jgi:predicted metal-dependent HD superfamily phosphohydrolase